MKFYDLFEEDTGNLLTAARSLVEMFEEGFPDREARAQLIKAY
jgi:hypothetical protein